LFRQGKGRRTFFGPRRRWKLHTKPDLKVTDVEYIKLDILGTVHHDIMYENDQQDANV